MKTVFKARLLARVLFAAVAVASLPARSADRLYYIVDEKGVWHFSNVPGDARYRPLPAAGNVAPLQPVSLPGASAVPQQAARAVPAAVAAQSFAELDTAEPLPEDIDSEEMLTGDGLTPDVEFEAEDR